MEFLLNANSNFTSLNEVALRLNNPQLVDDLKELSSKLNQNRFYLVVIGLFKRGKSSLINALVGKELAPVAVTPLTSVITFFEYSSSTHSEIYFENGNKIPVEPDEIVQYVSEEFNPKNAKQVKYIRVFSNSAILENLILVDTPGVGSVFTHNSDTTFDFLPKIDAALFVLSADLPISKTDEEFLVQIRDSAAKVLFVMNKADLLSQNELAKVKQYNQKILGKIFKTDSASTVELIPVSTKWYFDNQKITSQNTSNDGISTLRARIEEQIVESKNEILLTNTRKRIVDYTERLSTLLTVKLNSLQLPVHELEQKKEAMQASIDYLNANLDDFQAIIKNRIQLLKDKVEIETNTKRVQLLSHCQKVLVDDSHQTWLKVKSSDDTAIQKDLYEFIIKQFAELKDELEVSVKEEFQNIILQYSKQSQSFLNNIITQMRDLLGVNIENIVSVFDLNVYSDFYFKEDIKYYINPAKESITQWLLPDFIVKRKTLSRIHGNCIDLINPNAGRIRSDITYKIDESFRKFKYHFDHHIFELLNSFKKIIVESIEAKSSTQKEIEDNLNEIKSHISVVNRIKSCYL